MTRRSFPFARLLRATFWVALLLAVPLTAAAQSGNPPASPYERTYPLSKSAVEKVLKELQPSMRGRLPLLEGFALPGEHSFDRYRRAYYQSAVQVSSTASGGSVVRVSTKVTAWYEDSDPSRSGYQLLPSNGRLESDLLDQLTDLLAGGSRVTDSGARSSQSLPAIAPPAASAKTPAIAEKGNADRVTDEPAISAPMPQLPETGRTFSSTLEQGLSAQRLASAKNSQNKLANPPDAELQEEATSLEEVLKNQAHPKNLVAIKKSGTPVVASPSLNGKTLFLASAHDEFEMLDYNIDWVHVRISDVPQAGANATLVAADLFQVTREETAPFPGDWEPLRGKNVKIISVQKIQEDEKNSGAPAKLEYTKFLLEKNYTELAAKSQELSGVVLIFDSVDGGMIAATLPTVQAWKAGTLTDAALWHRCYFDPPETFSISAPAGGH
jgi:hypothetical protein